MQRALLELVVSAAYLSLTEDSTTCKASKLVLAAKLQIESLPPDFWKKEVLGWEQESFASMQIAMSYYSIGGPGAVAEKEADDAWWLKPTTEAEKKLCKAQKMKKSGGFV
jgi:hypothetical protein